MNDMTTSQTTDDSAEKAGAAEREQAGAAASWLEHEDAVAPSVGDGSPVTARRRWRPVAVLGRVAVVALIGAAIWYLQFKPTLPFVGGSDANRAVQTSGDNTPGAGFVTFGSQGIKLGAAGGPAPKIGEPAPDFALLDPTGKVIRLSDLRGMAIVMNFWATWCAPCRKEFPELVKLQDRNAARGLVVLGINLQENPDMVRNFMNEFGAKFPSVIDTEGDVAKQYRLLGLPTTYFIDGEGVLRGQHVGLLTEEILARKLGEAGFTVARSQ